MKFLKHSFLAIIAVSMMGAFAIEAIAQDNEARRTAVQTFNSARELAQNNEYDAAIEKFQEAIEAGQAAEDAGQKGADIVEMSTEKLPAIYYSKALSDYKAFQSARTVSSLETTIASFNSAADAGEQYGKQSIVDKSTGNITQLMYMKSVLQYSQKNYEAAMASVDAVIERDSEYEKAYYQKGLIYKKMDGNFDNALTTFDKAIEVSEANGNSEIARKARENASGELIYRGSQSTQNGSYASAIEMLNQALEYNPESVDAHYRLAEAYNSRGDFKSGLNHAQKALDLENGGRNAKAKIYYQLASAYKGQGNFSQACDSYSNAAYGQFKQRANHEMEYELNCDSQ